MTFAGYAENFFGDNSQWMQDKIQSCAGKPQPVAKNTLRLYRHLNTDYLIPYFARLKLADIKPIHIKKFRQKMIDEGKSNGVINVSCVCLKIIFSYAISDGFMLSNPFSTIQQMYINARSRSAFDEEILKTAFSKEWKNDVRKICCMIGAVTGMRMSELLAIRKDTLFEDYIDVRDQRYNGEIMPVKDCEMRKVRISSNMYKMISWCINQTGEFAFPECSDIYRYELYEYCELTKEKRKESRLSFHSLRHFFNTYLLNNEIPELKVKSILGHSSGKGSMTERYANFTPEHFDDVAVLQDRLLKKFDSQNLLRRFV